METSEHSLTPPGLANLMKTMALFHTTESLSKGAQFVPAPTDVIISTGPKSGTTWVQQICHGLRSGGDMTFDEISLVIPCLELAHDYGYTDLQIPQPYAPRMYKTHMWYPFCPKGAGKYIILARKPADAAVSFYHFATNWTISTEDVSIKDFVKRIILNVEAPKNSEQFVSNFDHIVSWYPHRLDDNVLWLHFEDLKQNLSDCVRRIAEFLDIGKDDDKLQELVTHQATFEFMKAHDRKFDEHPFKLARNEAAGFPKEAGTNGIDGKVRSGLVNESKSALSVETLAEFDRKWKEVVMPIAAYATYDEMREGINKELGRSFI